MPRTIIAGTGSYLPPDVVTNQDLVDRYGIDTDDAWIVQRTGIRERRFAAPGVGTADLAEHASRAALDAAGIAAGDLDWIIFCTLSPEKVFPGSGVYLQQRLGLPDLDPPRYTPCLDVRNQCSGFLYGLSCADAMIRSGAARRVLLVGAELHSAGLDLSTRGRSVASLFGDGAGAVVLEAGDDEARGLQSLRLGADGRYADDLSQAVWDIHQRPFVPLDAQGRGVIEPEQLWASMNGRLVFKHAVEHMTRAVQDLLAAEQLEVDDIDLFCFHQANLRINHLVQEHLGIAEDRAIHHIERYGNTTAATIPLLLDEAVRTGRLAPGARVVLCAFGSGFTWGAGLYRC